MHLLSEEEAAQPTLSEALAAAQAEAEAARSAMALQDEALIAAAKEVEAAQELVAAKGAEVSQLKLKLDMTLDAGRPNRQEVDPMVQRVQEAERAHEAQVRKLAAQLKEAALAHKTRVAGLEAELISYRLKGLQEAVASSSATAHEPVVDETAPPPPDMQMILEEVERVKTRAQHSQRAAEQARQDLGEAQREGQATARQLEAAREAAALAGDRSEERR